MCFHCSLNSLFYLLEHTILFCIHDYISSSVLCQHTRSGYFILFSLLSIQAQSAWHGRLQEAGTAHLGHKLKTSRSQNTTAASSLTLCPGSLWRSGAKWWCWGGGLSSAQITPQLSCVQCRAWAFRDCAFHPQLLQSQSETLSVGDAQIFSSVRSRGLEGAELFLLPTCYFLEFPSIFHRLVEEGKSLRMLSLFFFPWEV